MIFLLGMLLGAALTVLALVASERISQARHAARIGMPESGSAVSMRLREPMVEDGGTVTVLGEWSEWEGWDDE